MYSSRPIIDGKNSVLYAFKTFHQIISGEPLTSEEEGYRLSKSAILSKQDAVMNTLQNYPWVNGILQLKERPVQELIPMYEVARVEILQTYNRVFVNDVKARRKLEEIQDAEEKYYSARPAFFLFERPTYFKMPDDVGMQNMLHILSLIEKEHPDFFCKDVDFWHKQARLHQRLIDDFKETQSNLSFNYCYGLLDFILSHYAKKRVKVVNGVKGYSHSDLLDMCLGNPKNIALGGDINEGNESRYV